MAVFSANFWDDDGIMYIFGKITEDNNANTCRSVDVIIDSTYTYSYTLENPTTFPGAFSLNTSDHKTGSAPARLSSGNHTPYFKFYNSSGTVIAQGNLLYEGKTVTFNMHNTLYTPTIAYDDDTKKLTVSNEGRVNKRYFVEIRRSNRNLVNTDYTEEEKDYLWETLIINREAGKYNQGIPATSFYDESDGTKDGINDGEVYFDQPISRFFYDRYWTYEETELRAIVIFDTAANFTTAKKTEYHNQIKSILTEYNDTLLSDVDVKFDEDPPQTVADGNLSDWYACAESDQDIYGDYDDDDRYDLIIRIGNNASMDVGGQGRWVDWRWDKYAEAGNQTSHAFINVDKSADNESIAHVMHEEIIQSSGLGQDSYSHYTSLNWDPEYTNPDTYTGIDARIFKMALDYNTNGKSVFQLTNELDVPLLLFKTPSDSSDMEFDISELSNGTYDVKCWVAELKGDGTNISGTSGGTSGTSTQQNDGWDDDRYSLKATLTISKHTGTKPSKFEWDTAKVQGGSMNLTASEWNRFQNFLKSVLVWANGTSNNYTPDNVERYQEFKKDIYNLAVDAEQSVPGYGTYVSKVNSGDTITADRINLILSEANAILGYT